MIKTTYCIITTDFIKNQKYVLSLREDSIILPSFNVESYKNLNKQAHSMIVEQAFEDHPLANEYVKTKFISINDEYISNLFSDVDSYLYFLYGCICPKLTTKPNFYWKTFDIYDTTIRQELGVINNVISITI